MALCSVSLIPWCYYLNIDSTTQTGHAGTFSSRAMETFLKRKSTVTEGASTTVVLKHGPVHQWGHRVKTWKKRFMIVDTDQIQLFETAQDLHKDSPAVRISISEITSVKEVPPAGDSTIPATDDAFCLVTGGRPYYIRADTHDDTDEWIATIQLAIEISPAHMVGLKQGYMWKKGAQHHNWKRRWFVLSHDSLAYYERKDSDKPLGVIPLREVLSVGDAAEEMAELTSQRDAFGVACVNRTYVCKCESPTSQDAWIDSVRSVAAIHRILEARDKGGSNDSTMTQVSSIKRLAQNACTMAMLGNRVSLELSPTDLEMRQHVGCAVSALGDAFTQSTAAFVAALPLTVRVSGEGAHVLRSLRQSHKATHGRVANILASANLVKEAVAQLLVLVKTSVGDEVTVKSGAGSGAELSSCQSLLRDIVIAARQLKSNLDAVTEAQQALAGMDEPGRTAQEEVVDVAKETVSAAQLVANAINGTDAQLVQASKLASGLVQRLISCSVAVCASTKNTALRELIVDAHTNVRSDAIQMVVLARKSTSASSSRASFSAGTEFKNELMEASRSLAGSINNLVALAGVAAQHHIAEEQLESGKTAIVDCMRRLESHTEDGTVNDKDTALTLVQGCMQMISGIQYLSAAISGVSFEQCSEMESEGGPSDVVNLSVSVTTISDAVSLLVNTAVAVAKGLSDPDLRSHLNRSINIVKDLTVQLHTVIKKAVSQEKTEETQRDSTEDEVVLLPEGTRQASRNCSHVLQVASVCKSLSSAYANLLDIAAYVGTKDYITSAAYAAQDDVDIWSEVDDDSTVIYTETGEAKAARPIRAATLNKLVIRLTSESAVDLKFQKTILTTYRSFTTPYQLFQKLVQRYQVPVPSSISDIEQFNKAVRLPIQLRVCNVIAQWIESSYHDFNAELHAKMASFIEKNVQPNHAALAAKLIKLLSRKLREVEQSVAESVDRTTTPSVPADEALEDRTDSGTSGGEVSRVSSQESDVPPAVPATPERRRVMFESDVVSPSPGKPRDRAGTGASGFSAESRSVSVTTSNGEPQEDGVGVLRSMTLAAFRPFGGRRDYSEVTSPAEVVEKVDEADIATQLTLIEWDIYHRIEPVELLRQAWNKEKLKHLAPNVTLMISRFNVLSAWVSSTILWQEKLKARAKIMAKWINVAESLRRINNFNSLLAILSGLNSSGVYRLRFTKEEVPRRQQATLRELEELMDSKGSYKNYRQNLHNVNPPVTPYLGVYLTDLTFIEDGNPDDIHGLINYKKRELVYNVIQEVKQYQDTRYSDVYEGNGHIQLLLHQMHGADENELYELSLLREPRGATIDDIV